MDRVDEWRCLIKQYLTDLYDVLPRSGSDSLETVCIFDETRDHYLLMRVGWEEDRHVQYTTLHVRIKNGRIWIEEDWTEEGIANALLREGVSASDIVLGFQHPSMRPLTDFAAA